MTEVEWRTSTRPTAMLLFIRSNASQRKVLLFNCACCRRVWSRLDTEDHEAIKNAEASVDDLATMLDLEQQLQPQRETALALAGLGDQNYSVSESSLVHLLTTRTTIRLDLFGQGYGIGILAFEAAKLSAFTEPRLATVRPHIVPSEATAPEELRQAEVVREVFGNPFRPIAIDPAWLNCNDGAMLRLAQAIYNNLDFEFMPILADALEEAGCHDQVMMAHCREHHEHVRGCWVVDLILGRK